MSILRFWWAIFSGAFFRLYFGGDSEQQQQTDQSQVYNDSRTATQNTWQTRTAYDSHANSGNTAGSFNTSTLQNWLSSVTNSLTNTNSGNTSTAVTDARNLASTTSDSGNTSAQWWQANSDSHAVTNSGNTSTAVTDARNLASTTSDSRSTVINYTGTDGGIGRIADMIAGSLGATADSNAASLRELARYGAGVGADAAELAALSQANSLQLSTHMLDLTGDLIGRMATGAALTTAAQVDAVRSTAASATAQSKASGDSGIKAAWIAGGLALLAVVLH